MVKHPDEQSIRDRAYLIWEREGRPDGRERDHWLQAVWELSGDAARIAAARPKAVKDAPGSSGSS